MADAATMRDLLFAAPFAVVVLLLGAGWMVLDGRSEAPRVVHDRVLCYVQTEHPVMIVCPGGDTWWHPVGRATPLVAVPKN